VIVLRHRLTVSPSQRHEALVAANAVEDLQTEVASLERQLLAARRQRALRHPAAAGGASAHRRRPATRARGEPTDGTPPRADGGSGDDGTRVGGDGGGGGGGRHDGDEEPLGYVDEAVRASRRAFQARLAEEDTLLAGTGIRLPTS